MYILHLIKLSFETRSSICSFNLWIFYLLYNPSFLYNFHIYLFISNCSIYIFYYSIFLILNSMNFIVRARRPAIMYWSS